MVALRGSYQKARSSSCRTTLHTGSKKLTASFCITPLRFAKSRLSTEEAKEIHITLKSCLFDTSARSRLPRCLFEPDACIGAREDVGRDSRRQTGCDDRSRFGRRCEGRER